jgi:hypothetical protein
VPNIVIQNLTTEDVHLGDFYTKVPKPEKLGPGEFELGIVETFKTSVEIMQSVSLQKAIAEGKVSLGITFTQDEIDSGFDIWPGLTAGVTDLSIRDEGVLLTTTPTDIDFVGDAVTASVVGNYVTVTVAGSGANRIYNEKPSGVFDSINDTFTTSVDYVPGSEALFYNGVRLTEGVLDDYTRVESGGPGTGFDSLVLACPPLPGEHLLIDFDPA